ncbi:hypothetical protein AAMO2058_001339200 [Amorphochlora amoebiformis]
MTEVKRQRVIVVAVDGSEYSKNAWIWSVDNILKDTDEVKLVHVFNHESVSTFDYLTKNYKKILELHKEFTTKMRNIQGTLLHSLVKYATDKGLKAKVTPEVIEVKEGGPKHTILEYIKSANADMLVVSSRGAGAFGRAFLGSVSDYLVHNSEIPVVVVK